MNPRVRKVTPGDDRMLLVEFSNGETGVYDCGPLLEFGVFKELKDQTYFRRVFVDRGTVAWPNDQDICPDTVYLESDRSVAAAV